MKFTLSRQRKKKLVSAISIIGLLIMIVGFLTIYLTMIEGVVFGVTAWIIAGIVERYFKLD